MRVEDVKLGTEMEEADAGTVVRNCAASPSSKSLPQTKQQRSLEFGMQELSFAQRSFVASTATGLNICQQH